MPGALRRWGFKNAAGDLIDFVVTRRYAALVRIFPISLGIVLFMAANVLFAVMDAAAQYFIQFVVQAFFLISLRFVTGQFSSMALGCCHGRAAGLANIAPDAEPSALFDGLHNPDQFLGGLRIWI